MIPCSAMSTLLGGRAIDETPSDSLGAKKKVVVAF